MRKSPKRYKNFRTASARAHVRRLVQVARATAEGNLYSLIKVPKTNDNFTPNANQISAQNSAEICEQPKCGVTANDASDLPEELRELETKYVNVPFQIDFKKQFAYVPTYTKLDAAISEWTSSLPAAFLEMLKGYRDIFPDKLPPGLPVRRCIDHTIPTVAGKLPPKGPIYNLDHESKLAMKKEILKLAEKQHITHTSSPYGAPCMLVSKKSDKPGGEKQ